MKEWKGKLEMWAHAYLPGAPHTNGLIESYHGVIKSLFFVTKCALLLFQQTLYPVCKRAMLTLAPVRLAGAHSLANASTG